MKVSVIIPVYNVEDYLRECLDSVLSQTLGEIELLCVDDGSTDGSLAILREYADRDSRVRVLEQANQGPGRARNRALSAAMGKYVSFVDPDDLYGDEHSLEVLYGLAENLKCPVSGGYVSIFGGDMELALNKNWMQKNAYPYLGELAYADYQSPFGFQRYLFSTEMLRQHGVEFLDLRRFQDPPFCARALCAAGRLAVTDQVVYRYRKQHSSVDWAADGFRRAKDWLSGMDGLFHFAVENGYERMMRQVASDFRSVIPMSVVQACPELGVQMRKLAEAVRAECPVPQKVLFVCQREIKKVGSNPFVSILASGLEAKGVTVDFGQEKLAAKFQNYQVIHFQWPEAVFDWQKKKITHADVVRIQELIRLARSVGIRTCYTRHNAHPHYVDLPDLDDLYRVIETECDTVIHMGDFSHSEYVALHDYPLVRHCVIPHHVYPTVDRTLSPRVAKARLGFSPSDRILLAFGMFRDEEECELVVEGYRAAEKKIPGLKLLAPRLPARYGFGSGQAVSAEVLSICFAAADVVLIPRREILNSGNLPMAFYFGKVVVGPDVGNVGEILRETGNPVFSTFDGKSVGDAVVAGFALDGEGMGARNRAVADERWNLDRVSNMLLDAYAAPFSCEQMTDVRAYRLRNNGIQPAAWAADAMFETVWEKVMARPIQDFTPDPKTMSGNAIYRERYRALPAIVPSVRFSDSVDEPEGGFQYAFLWGNGHYPANACVLAAALKYDMPMIICEDGWLRSADTWANFSAPDRYRHGCSLILEARGCYYDATRVSTVEMMLNDRNVVVSDAERESARRLIRRIVDNKLTKYNHQPIFQLAVGRPGKRKVLVVDQSYGDFAIRKGWADDSTFERMLQCAIDENPDADVLVKTHPDTMTGARKGYYDGLREEGNVFRVTMPINPYSLMECVDKVYVCSTQFGFEALMAGKEVHVFGMPFYAGWGLTIDDQKNPRRTNRRSLEEVFHIFYLRYTHWMNPETGHPCTIDESIDHLLRLRDKYRDYLAHLPAVAPASQPKKKLIDSDKPGVKEKKMAREIKSLRGEISRLKKSGSYRVGLFVTWPLRKAVGFVRAAVRPC